MFKKENEPAIILAVFITALMVIMVFFIREVKASRFERCNAALLEVEVRELCVSRGPPECYTTSGDALALARAHARLDDVACPSDMVITHRRKHDARSN